MSEKEEHIGERYSLVGLVGNPGFVVQTIVQILPPLDSYPIDIVDIRFQFM